MKRTKFKVTVFRYDNKQALNFEGITSWTFQGEYLVLNASVNAETVYIKQNIIASFYVKAYVEDSLPDSS